ncbi:hypothetical protein B0H34DRAFT_713139 [Crassisporium funariophilum]|nr:hypothetical protein B0H34DRAFT_713139 [Crassisporium funariophilum]
MQFLNAALALLTTLTSVVSLNIPVVGDVDLVKDNAQYQECIAADPATTVCRCPSMLLVSSVLNICFRSLRTFAMEAVSLSLCNTTNAFLGEKMGRSSPTQYFANLRLGHRDGQG